MKKNCLIALFTVLFFVPANLHSKEAGNLKFRKIRSGLYNSEITHKNRDKNAATGVTNIVKTVDFIKTAKKIPAETGVEFGLEWIVELENNCCIPVTIIWTFPEPMINDNGESFDNLKYSVSSNVNRPAYAGYVFEKDYEIIKGKWTFELFYNNEKVLKHTFRVK